MKVISSAPTRIGLFGGSTDVGEYASKHGGICINLAINIRQRVILGGDNALLKNDNPNFFKAMVQDCPVSHKFSGPIESGLGSSAALGVALVGGVNKINDLHMTRSQIAETAWDIEVNKLGLFGGKQDQYASVYGGANLLIFEDKVYRYTLPKKKIEKIIPHLCLFYLGTNRKSANIQEGLRTITQKQRISLDRIKDLAYEALVAIDNEDLLGLGYLMDEAWEQKKLSNAGVSNRDVGDIYNKAKDNGAIGGKVLGAGGGGHMLFITNDPERLIAKMPIKHIPFEVDWEGLKVEEV